MKTFNEIHEYCKACVEDKSTKQKAVALCDPKILDDIVESAGDKVTNMTPSKIGDIDIHFKSCTIVSDNFSYTFIAPEEYSNTNKIEIAFESEGKTIIYDCNC